MGDRDSQAIGGIVRARRLFQIEQVAYHELHLDLLRLAVSGHGFFDARRRVFANGYAGVSQRRLEGGETLQWPVKDAEHSGTPILHVGQFSRGKGQFNPIEHIPPAELPDKEYPMLLSTGRVLFHWHDGQMTRRSKGLLEIYPEALIEVNDTDAEKMGLNGNKRVRVSSRRGTIEAQAMVTDRVPPGMVYANFHFPEASANELTIAALDPVAKIPEYKVCAVKVEAV